MNINASSNMRDGYEKTINVLNPLLMPFLYYYSVQKSYLLGLVIFKGVTCSRVDGDFIQPKLRWKFPRISWSS